MFGLFDSVLELASNTAKIVVTPVAVAADVLNAAVKPLAEVAEDLAKDIHSAIR